MIKYLNVLIIDDETELTELLQEVVLNSFPSFKVKTANSVQQAISLLKESNFEIVLTDIKMPVASGTELIKKIRSEGRKSQIIVISGQSDHTDLVQCLKYQANDFIAKPFQTKDIFEAISRAISNLYRLETEENRFLEMASLEERVVEMSSSLLTKCEEIRGLILEITPPAGGKKPESTLLNLHLRIDEFQQQLLMFDRIAKLKE